MVKIVVNSTDKIKVYIRGKEYEVLTPEELDNLLSEADQLLKCRNPT